MSLKSFIVSRIESRNDALIDQLLKDPLYKVTKEGKVYSKLTKNGQGITDEWRELGYKKKDGYIRFRYKNEFLFVHRVVYRKYNGELKPHMTINHKNLNNSDNHYKNLELVTQKDNNNNKHKTYKKQFVEKVAKKLGTL